MNKLIKSSDLVLKFLFCFSNTRLLLIKLETLGGILPIIKFVFSVCEANEGGGGSLTLSVPVFDQQGGAATGGLQILRY